MKFWKLRNNLAFNIISAIVFLLVFFSVLVSTIGYISFTNSLKREYTDMAYRTANTALTLVDGDKIDQYLETGEGDPAYDLAQSRMDILCSRMDLPLIYVIKVDTSDYNSFVSVFNSVHENSTRYTRWEAGHFRETTNEEYRQLYIDLYENGLPYGTIYRTKDLNGAEPHLTLLVPVKDSADRTTAILCVQRPMNELVAGRRPYLINIVIATVLLSALVTVSAAAYIRRQFVSPLKKVISEADRFAKETKHAERPLPESISKIYELQNLASAVNTMEHDMLRYIDNLTRITAEKERIGTELSIASQIQEASIPTIFPAYPDRKEFDIYACMTPAKEVGGDFYDFFLIDDDHLAMVMADVSGKGVPAALFMMVTKILLNDRALMGGTPAEILTFVNDRICENNKADMFVTVWMGILEISTGTVTAANAGHDDPAVCRRDGSFEIVKSKHSPVIGAMEGIRYRDFEIRLRQGDKLFLYTDGVPEATDAQSRMFSIPGMLDALNAAKQSGPKDVLSAVWDRVNVFVGDAPQFDDLTMLCLEMKGNVQQTQTLHIEAAKENLTQVIDFVDNFLQAQDCPMKAQMQIDLCVEEIFVNIAQYAYGDSVGKAEISIENSDGEITIVFKDGGKPYNPLEETDPDLSLSADEREIGGLGIFLTKKNADRVTYSYEAAQNVLTIKKRIC